jgi:hypothetical protein
MDLIAVSQAIVLGKCNISFHGLEDDTEEVSHHLLISEPELDLQVYTAWSYKCVIKPLDMIGSHDQDTALS